MQGWLVVRRIAHAQPCFAGGWRYAMNPSPTALLFQQGALFCCRQRDILHTGQLVRKYPLLSVKLRTTAPTNKRCLQNSKPGFIAGTGHIANQPMPHSKSLNTSQTSHQLPLTAPTNKLLSFKHKKSVDWKNFPINAFFSANVRKISGRQVQIAIQRRRQAPVHAVFCGNP